jgi:hypothetical protein
VPVSPFCVGGRLSKIANLKKAKNKDDLARLLGYRTSFLTYVVYVIPDALKYSEFKISKRDGSTRLIAAPEPRLRLLQRRLASYLADCLEEIEKAGSPRRPIVHGFTRKRSIVTNASQHKRNRYVFNILFDPALLTTKIDGKTFNRKKEHDDSTTYGKT